MYLVSKVSAKGKGPIFNIDSWKIRNLNTGQEEIS